MSQLFNYHTNFIDFIYKDILELNYELLEKDSSLDGFISGSFIQLVGEKIKIGFLLITNYEDSRYLAKVFLEKQLGQEEALKIMEKINPYETLCEIMNVASGKFANSIHSIDPTIKLGLPVVLEDFSIFLKSNDVAISSYKSKEVPFRFATVMIES